MLSFKSHSRNHRCSFYYASELIKKNTQDIRENGGMKTSKYSLLHKTYYNTSKTVGINFLGTLQINQKAFTSREFQKDSKILVTTASFTAS